MAPIAIELQRKRRTLVGAAIACAVAALGCGQKHLELGTELTADMVGGHVVRLPAEAEVSYFLGEIRNKGELAIPTPTATIEVRAANGKVRGVDKCQSPIPILKPGERVPCEVRFEEVTDAEKFDAKLEMQKWTGKELPPNLDVTSVSVVPRTDTEFARVEGILTNRNKYPVKDIWTVASLYDAAGKIVGAEQLKHEGLTLQPGQSVPFKMTVFDLEQPAVKETVRAIGAR